MRHVHGGDIYSLDHDACGGTHSMDYDACGGTHSLDHGTCGAIVRRQVIDFSANMNPLGMPEAVKQAAQAGAAASDQYPQPFARSLCERITAYESARLQASQEKRLQASQEKRLQASQEKRLQTDQDKKLQEDLDKKLKVFAGNGAADLIFLLTRALQPEEGVVFTPSFAEYEAALRAAGSTISMIPLDEENGFALSRHEIGSMRRHLAAKADQVGEGRTVVFVGQPGNPTGVLVEQEHLLELLKICRRFEAWLVIDACFVPLLEEDQVRAQEKLLAQCLEYERTIVLSAFTKAFAMPGLRLGYLLCRDSALIPRLEEVSQPWSVSVPAMMAGEAALAEGEYLIRSRAYIKKQKELLLDAFAHMIREDDTGLVQKIYGHAANYIFFRGRVGLHQQLARQGIQIRDCSNFTGLEEGYYRIAVRTEEENEMLLDAMRRVETFWREY